MISELQQKVSAIREALNIGCSGAHKSDTGEWMPCSSLNEFMHSVFGEEIKSRLTMDDMSSWASRRTRKGKKKRRRGWEKLGERGVVSIDSLSNGSLVSGGISTKSVQQAYSPRDNDSDVFTDIESARARSRQMGCIGVSRRISKSGKIVWMPCTNMSDYSRLTGTTALGRRHQQEAARKIVRTVLKDNAKKRKKSISEELGVKSIGRTLRSAAQRFDPKAFDGDNDGIVQEGSAFERPSVPGSVPKVPRTRSLSSQKENTSKISMDGLLGRNLDKNEIRKAGEWSQTLKGNKREQTLWPPVEVFEHIPARSVSRERGMLSASISNLPSIASQPSVINNPNATPSNPLNGIGGRAMADIIFGLVKPENRNKKDRKFYFIGGTTGSGKSKVVEYLQSIGIIPTDEEAAHIDPDFIKMGLPGYRDGAGAGAVHGQSRQVTDYVIGDAAKQGMDIIVQGTGKRPEHPRGAKQRGESVVAHYVYAPVKTAEQRMIERGKQTGRSLDTWLAGVIAREIPVEVSRMIDRGDLDEFYLWDNSGDMESGFKPILIASKSPGKKMEINDRVKFEDFAGGSRWAQEWEQKLNGRDPDIQTNQ
jgi:predicted ABC-type ATPase